MEMKQKNDKDEYFSVKDSTLTKNLSKTVFYLLMFLHQLVFSIIHLIILFAEVLKDFKNEAKLTIKQRCFKIQKKTLTKNDHK